MLRPSGPVVFQSTRPARGATVICCDQDSLLMFQSTRPARGATVICCDQDSLLMFQSTRPARGATKGEEGGEEG